MLARVVLLLIVSFTLAAPAGAATAIVYSAPEGTYGWCAGYATSRAPRCASDYCVQYGGTACELALICDGGWGAVARPREGAKGIGASCGYASASSARAAALLLCIDAARAVCWTDAAFDSRGNAVSADANGAADVIWYTQQMLHARGYDPGVVDGEMGARTRAALSAFMADLGLPETSAPGPEVFARLLDAIAGEPALVLMLSRDVLGPNRDLVADVTFGHATRPAPTVSFNRALTYRSVEERLLALATLVATAGSPCTLPALAGFPVVPSGGVWQVDCAEGSYILRLNSETRTVLKR